MQKNKQQGFTLIELMVVISIIALLSSIVLAGLQDAKDKATARAYKQSMMELVKGIELYRADTGSYPYETELASTNFISYLITVRRPGVTPGFTSDPALTDLSVVLKKYIPKVPNPPSGVFVFRRSTIGRGKCFGDQTNPPYILIVPAYIPGFEDWQYADSDDLIDLTNRCFSIK